MASSFFVGAANRLRFAFRSLRRQGVQDVLRTRQLARNMPLFFFLPTSLLSSIMVSCGSFASAFLGPDTGLFYSFGHVVIRFFFFCELSSHHNECRFSVRFALPMVSSACDGLFFSPGPKVPSFVPRVITTGRSSTFFFPIRLSSRSPFSFPGQGAWKLSLLPSFAPAWSDGGSPPHLAPTVQCIFCTAKQDFLIASLFLRGDFVSFFFSASHSLISFFYFPPFPFPPALYGSLGKLRFPFPETSAFSFPAHNSPSC